MQPNVSTHIKKVIEKAYFKVNSVIYCMKCFPNVCAANQNAVESKYNENEQVREKIEV